MNRIFLSRRPLLLLLIATFFFTSCSETGSVNNRLNYYEIGKNMKHIECVFSQYGISDANVETDTRFFLFHDEFESFPESFPDDYMKLTVLKVYPSDDISPKDTLQASEIQWEGNINGTSCRIELEENAKIFFTVGITRLTLDIQGYAKVYSPINATTPSTQKIDLYYSGRMIRHNLF